jgi:hypothetical protein
MNLEQIVKEHLKKASELYQDGKTPESGWLDELTKSFIESLATVKNETPLRLSAVEYAGRISTKEDLIENAEKVLKFLKG